MSFEEEVTYNNNSPFVVITYDNETTIRFNDFVLISILEKYFPGENLSEVL